MLRVILYYRLTLALRALAVCLNLRADLLDIARNPYRQFILYMIFVTAFCVGVIVAGIGL